MTDLERLSAALSDRYTVERELGRGGMATVYLAEDLKHHRQVAIKVLHPDLAAGLGAERFVREIETAAGLHHPHILPLYDSGRTGGQADGLSDESLYYVMPYVEGESLQERLDREKQLPVEDALQITREVADALQYAHERDVLHRDIKPENIMLASGHAMVADFGVARAITEAGGETLTSTGLAVGTPIYMSPEQAAAEKRLDGRSDLYSLGCLLYEMLAGEPPHTGPTAQAILARRLSEPAPSLRAVRESVPEAVHLALAKALSRAPADRHATVVDFVEALDRAPTGPAVALSSGRRWMTGVAAVLVIAVLLVVGYLIGSDRSEELALPDSTAAEPSVAVMPFRVVGENLDFWHDGIMDLLSFNLDGVTGLRKVDPQVVLHALDQTVAANLEVVSTEAALATARRIGARYAVTGSVVQLGSGIRLAAEVHESESGLPIGPPVQVDGPADSILTLVDLLAVDLLRQGIGDEKDPSVNLSRVTTGSLPALKAYLAGERKYRRAEWQDAAREFRLAVDLDSTFARAWYRLSWSHAWNEDYRLAHEYAVHSATMASDLPERDSLLLMGNGQAGAKAIGTLELLASRYPDDVDGWHLLGDRYFHRGGKVLAPSSAFRNALRTAIELSPRYGESYIHSIEDAFIRLDSARTRELIDGYGGIDLETPPCPGFGLVWDLVWGDSTARVRADEVVWADPEALDCAWITVAAAPRASQSIERLHLETMEDRDRTQGSRLFRLWRTMQGRLMRGQVAAGRRAVALAGFLPDARPYAAHWEVMLYLSGLTGSSAPSDAVGLMTQTPGPLNNFWLGALAVSDGRWEDVERAAQFIEGNHEMRNRGDSLQAAEASALAAGLQAYAAVMRDGTTQLTAFEAALRELPTESFRLEYPQQFVRYSVGRMLFERGDLRQAEKYFRSFYQYDFTHLVPAHYYLGRIYEELGRTEDAVLHYGLFVEWWRDSDPELRSWWEEGREALARLSGEPRGRAEP